MLLKLLKRETQDLHAEAERHVRILDANATDATYVRYLQRMHGFHAAIEDAFAAHEQLAAAGFDAPARRKCHLIAEDLAAFGAALGPRAPLPAPGAIAGLARGIGAAYVVEGSTLGGAFILSRMQPRRSTRFLAGYGDDTGPRWKQFAAIAARIEDRDEARDAAVASARATFSALIAWLDEPARAQPHPHRGLARLRA